MTFKKNILGLVFAEKFFSCLLKDIRKAARLELLRKRCPKHFYISVVIVKTHFSWTTDENLIGTYCTCSWIRSDVLKEIVCSGVGGMREGDLCAVRLIILSPFFSFNDQRIMHASVP